MLAELPSSDGDKFRPPPRSGEPGLLVCEISPYAPFSGYERDRQQTEKKKLRNVHKKGDVYFNTGDLLTIDREGFFYFSDRVGDTFRSGRLWFEPTDIKFEVTFFLHRWKGENVSTAEVADVLSVLDCISDAAVYGVHVPGNFSRC